MARGFSVYGCLVACGILFPSSAGAAITCTASTAPATNVRNEGLTELVADIVLNCTGNTAATVINLQLFLNTNVTSRSVGTDNNEALLLVNDPASPVLRQSVFVASRGTFSNALFWANVPFGPLAPGGSWRLRIKNVRANAAAIPSGAGLPGTVSALLNPTGFSVTPAQLVLGYVTPGLTFSVQSGSDPNTALGTGGAGVQPGVTAPTAPVAYLRFKEGGERAFRARGDAGPIPPVTTSADQYGTESGFRTGGGVPGLTLGLADFGTRLVARFDQIPRGVHVWVAINDTTGRARLTVGETAPYQPVPSSAVIQNEHVVEVALAGGTGTAVWEVVTNPDGTAALDFPVFFTTDAMLGDGTGTVRGRFGPISTVTSASETAPIPRFADTGAARSLVRAGLSLACTSADGPGRIGVPYSVDCYATRGAPPYAWSITGALPKGIGISASTGAAVKIAGTPTAVGSYSYAIVLADSSSPQETASVQYTGAVQDRIGLEIPGTATAIAAGSNGSTYIVATAPCDSKGCAPQRWTGNRFEPMAGSGTRLAVESSGKLWMTDNAGGIWRYADPTGGGSEQVPGSARDVAAGGNNVYILGTSPCDLTGCAPYRYNGANFEQMNGRGVRIAADSSGRLWMVDRGGTIYRYQSATAAAAADKISGTASAVAASGDGAVFIVGTAPCDGNGCAVARFDGNAFVPILGLTGTEIALERDMVVWLVTKPGGILRYAPNEKMGITCVPSTGPVQVGVAYEQTCTATDAQTPISWRITGELPEGVVFLSSIGTTMTIRGTPTKSGNYGYTIYASDSFIVPRTASLTISGTVAPSPLVTVLCASLPAPVTTGSPFYAECWVAGGAPPYTWSIAAGALPAGLSLSRTIGEWISISGTPTEGGNYTFRVVATDAAGVSGGYTFSGTIRVSLSIVCVADGTIPTVGIPYSVTCRALGGTAPYQWSISAGALPPGLALTSTTGTNTSIRGTPTASGPISFTLELTDGGMPPQSATWRFSGTIAAPLRTFNAASYEEGKVAADSIASVFGAGLAERTEVYDGSVVTTLGGVSVLVTDSAGVDRKAQLFFVSDGQINFLAPADVAKGAARISVTNNLLPPRVQTGSVMVTDIAPGVFVVTAGSTVPAAVYLRVTPAKEQTQGYTFHPETKAAAEIPRNSGDEIYLLLFGTGFRRHSGQVTATANGHPVPVLGAVAQGQFAGLDQINIGPLPTVLASGTVRIQLHFDGLPANEITVKLQ